MCCGLRITRVRTKIMSSDVFTWVSLSSGSTKTLLKSAFDLFFDFSFLKKNKPKPYILLEREVE